MPTRAGSTQASGAAEKDEAAKGAKPATKPGPEAQAKAAPKPPTKVEPPPRPAAPSAATTSSAAAPKTPSSTEGKTAQALRPPPPKTETAGIQPVAPKAPAPARLPELNGSPARTAPAPSKTTPETKSVSEAKGSAPATAGPANSNTKTAAPAARVEPVSEPVAKAAPARKPDSSAPPAAAVSTLDQTAETPAKNAPRASLALGLGASATPFTEINETILTFVRKEGEAAFAHVQALARATSPAELVRLQVGEIQRAADSSLSCLGSIVRSASRMSGLRLP